jgi:hypothetical protein
MSKRLAFYYIGTFLLVISTRVFELGSIPPGRSESFWLRLPTALAAILVIIFLQLAIFRRTKSHTLTLLTGLVMVLMPWQIEQSRIVSDAIFGLLVVTIALFLWTVAPCRRCKIVLIIMTLILLWRAFPSNWMTSYGLSKANISHLLPNGAILWGVDFLFSKNDSFWLGGLRTVGVLLPSLLPAFYIGIVLFIKRSRMVTLLTVFGLAAVVTVVAALNPRFPEEREFFLITPLLAILVAIGLRAIFSFWRNRGIFIKGLVLIYLLWIFYDTLLFWHFYTQHYWQRITNEIPYEQRVF